MKKKDIQAPKYRDHGEEIAELMKTYEPELKPASTPPFTKDSKRMVL